MLMTQPNWPSAVAFIFCKTIAEICSGANSFFSLFWVGSSTTMIGLPPGPSLISNGMCLISSPISENCLPIILLMLNKVFFGFCEACLLADSPTTLPASVKETHDAVVLSPSALDKTCASPSFHTETHEYVVPKSIPMTYSSKVALFIFDANLASSIFFFCANLASPMPSINAKFFGSNVSPCVYAWIESWKNPDLYKAKPNREYPFTKSGFNSTHLRASAHAFECWSNAA